MRSSIVACCVAALSIAVTAAQAADCPGHPGALGVSRTIVLDPTQHPLLGTLQYDESLPLNDHEVVLTFDDGPLQPYTNRVLDTLAAECVKATFFLVGRMALGYPHLVQREYAEGHTIAGHSQDHPFTFAKMTVDQASRQIEDGFESLRTVLGDPKEVSPFFRIPGLLRQDSVENYLRAHGYATWSLDFLADDWTHISSKEITRRALQRIEARGRGILLLHDIQPATAAALPTILAELKARGYKIVHVVPATPERPATVAAAGDWIQSHHSRTAWPRTLEVGDDRTLPSLAAPSVADFGISGATGEIVALSLTRDGYALESASPWPEQENYPIPKDNAVLPIASGQDFIYVQLQPLALPPHFAQRKGSRNKKLAAAPPQQPIKPGVKPAGGPKAAGPTGPTRSRPIGHQLSFTKPTASL